jgi:uncharacterized delta-60 repeat protein
MNSTIESNVAGLALQPDGKIVVGSVGQENGIFKIVIARLNPDGMPDESFGAFGVVTLSTGTVGASTFLEDLAIQADGKIVIGCLGGNPFDFIILRLNANGTVDTSFDTDGRAAMSLTAGEDRLQAIEIQTDGKIVAAGQTPGVVFGDSRIGVARFNTDGSPDLTFGSGGFTVANSGNLNINLNVQALALQSDGRIVVGAANQNRFGAARFHTNGTLDQSFDGDGLALVQLPGVTSNSQVNAVTIQRNGKIVLAGFSFDSSEFDYAVVRMNTDGSADSSFDGDGVFRVDLGNQGETIYAVTLQRDGKILLAGGINEFSRTTFAILRLTGDPTGAGAFDFDGDGKTDVAIFRPSVAEWWINRSSNGVTIAGQFGATTDKIVPGDFTVTVKLTLRSGVLRRASGLFFVRKTGRTSLSRSGRMVMFLLSAISMPMVRPMPRCSDRPRRRGTSNAHLMAARR